MQSPTFLEAAGEAAIGLYASGPDLNYAGNFYADTFLPAYEEVSGSATPLSVFHAHAFDAMNMIIKAIEEVAVQNADGSLTIDRQALRDRFFAFTDYPGITGSLTCDANGDCADPKISVGQVARISEVGADNCGATSGDVCFNRIWP
jgi:branched-chain amino acid transport system substrate-binding protein